MAKKAGMATGVEVARITVKVSPDTRDFRRKLKEELSDIERGANKAAKADLDVDTKNAEKQVKQASKRMGKSNSVKLTAEVELNGKKDSFDRFQRRTAAELQSGMNRLEPKIQLDFGGESFRRDIERAASELDRLIKKPIPKDKLEAAARRTRISEEINALMELGKDEPKADSNWLGVSERRLQLIERLGKIRKIAAEQDRQKQAALHRDQMAQWKNELAAMKMRSDEAAAYAKLENERLENERKARLAPDDGWRKSTIADLRKAAKAAEAGIGDGVDGEKDLRDLRERVRLTEELINAEISTDLEIAAGQRLKIKEEIEAINPTIDVDVDMKKAGVTGLSRGGGMKLSGMLPSFGSGINPAGYLVILAGAALVAAPLIGLLSTAVLAIPGLISAVATPFMAITLGLEGIKKAAAGSGLFGLNEKGEIDGLGAVFDKVKADISQAFDEGLSPSFKALADSIDPLLGSLPEVATGLSDMFKGFTDSLTSEEGMKLFDDTIKNIGRSMSDAAPGMQSFTDGMIGIANSFSQQLPGLSAWFNKTGEDFAKWVADMTAPIEGPGIDGKSKMDMAFEGLGDTLRTIGDWVVDMGEAGLKFVQDPKKMDDFVATLDNIGRIITNLVDMGNKLSGAWEALGMLPKLDPAAANAESEKIINPPQADIPQKKFWLDPVTEFFNDLFPKSMEQVNSDIEVINKGITELEGNIRDRLATSVYSPDEDPVLSNYKSRLNGLKEELEELRMLQAELDPVALKSNEKPLEVPADAAPKVPAPDTAEFSAEISKLPAATDEAMAAVTASIEAGGASASGAALIVAQNIYTAMSANAALFQTVGLQMMAGVAAGIQAGQSAAITAAANAASAALKAAKDALEIKSPSRKFMEIGDYSMQGMAKGLENGIGPVLEQAKELAGRIADVFSEGGDPTGLLSGMSKQEVSRIGKVLAFENRRLESQAKALDYQARLAGKGPQADALRARAAEIRQQKDQLSLQKDMLDLTKEYSDELGGSSGEDPFVKAASGLMNAPVDFAKATGKQFLSDLGVNGNGFISKAITEGISYVFNIASVDEAMSIKDRQDSKSSMVIGR